MPSSRVSCGKPTCREATLVGHCPECEELRLRTGKKDAIYGAMIVSQVAEKMRLGLGPPDVEDMKRYSEEAEAVVELWEESLSE